MEPLDTRGLTALRAVAETGSVAAAAAQLQWSQPTVNHHLRNLERTLGATLLDRTPRGSQPTTVGSLVVTRAVEILGLCQRLGAEVALWRESQAVPVRIGAVPTVGARVIPRLHDQLQVRPRWQTRDEAVAGDRTDILTAALDVTMDEHAKLVSRLESGDLDLALLVSTDLDRTWIPATLNAAHLYSERLFLCVPKSIGEISVDDHGFEPRVGMRMDDYAAINRMISAGLAVAMIPESSLSTDPDITVIPMPLSDCRRDVLLVSRAARPQVRVRHDPIVDAHISAIAEVVADVRTVTRQWR